VCGGDRKKTLPTKKEEDGNTHELRRRGGLTLGRNGRESPVLSHYPVGVLVTGRPRLLVSAATTTTNGNRDLERVLTLVRYLLYTVPCTLYCPRRVLFLRRFFQHSGVALPRCTLARCPSTRQRQEGSFDPWKTPINSTSTLSIHSTQSRRNHASRNYRYNCTTNNRPSWNSSPTEPPKFLPTLEQFLLGVNTNFRRLWTQRCVMYRARTYVLNATHARLLATDTYPSTYSFSTPAPAVVAYVASLTPVVTLPTPVAPSTGGDDEGASTTPPAAPPATPTVPAVTVTDYSQVLTAAEEKKFVINDDQIYSVDEELLEEILLCIPDLQERKDRRASAKLNHRPSGTVLLAKLHADAAAFDSQTTRTNVENEMTDLMESGISEASILGFNEWRNDYTMLNESLEENNGRLPQSAFAQRFVSAVCKLSDKIEYKLEGIIDRKGAKGNMEESLKAIRQVLSDSELLAKQARRNAARASGRSLAAADAEAAARALAAADPRK
jgi:hypothetical protein